MSKYLPLNFWYCLKTRQLRAVLTRIYINIFGIFLGIKLLPTGISKDCIDFYYQGDDIFWSFKEKKWYSWACEGEFNTLKEIDEFWQRYFDYCKKEYERETI